MSFIQLFVHIALLFTPQTAYAAANPVAVAPTVPVVMIAIAECESHQRQFKADGVHLIRDYLTGDHIGIYQISLRLHYKKALNMGMNIKKAEGNIAYALYLYRQNGTRDWNASRHCWNRALET